MPLSFARRIQALPDYPFAVIDEKVRLLREAGQEPIDFGVGDPTTPTPSFVRARLKTAVDERAASGYPSYIGSGEFRQAAASWIERRFGVSLDPATQVTSTIGSKEGIFHFPLAFVDPGDVVLCPSPGYPPYSRGALFSGGEPYFFPLLRENGFLPDFDAFPAEVVRRAKILWLCYPNAPTGAVAPAPLLQQAAEWGRRNGVLVVNDEAYCDFHYGEDKPPSILEFGTEGVVAFFSLSKRSAMTTWRVGFTAGDSQAIAAFRKVKTNVDSGTPTFVQDAAIAALADESHVAEMVAGYKARRDLLARTFVDLGFPDSTPQAALYLWQRLPDGVEAVSFATRLLAPEIGVVCTPGPWLGDPCAHGINPGDGYVRFALVPSLEETKLACARLRKALAN